MEPEEKVVTRWKYFEIQGFSEATAGFIKT